MTDLDSNATAERPSAPQWHLHIPPETYGPYSVQQLRDYAREGRMNAETLVWREGAAGWARAGDQPALEALFATLAPTASPVPPAGAPRATTSPYVLGRSGAVTSAGGAEASAAASAGGAAAIRETGVTAAVAPSGGRVAFADAVRTCVKPKYFTFHGRAARAEFWWFALFVTLATCVIYGAAMWLALATATDGQMTGLGVVAIIVAGLVQLILLPPMIAVAVRRLHDIGWSGWWYLAQLIPFAGGIIAIVILVKFLTRGNVGPNKYGADPLAGSF